MGVKLGQKWAVKDGNLLASNQVGSRFFNKEFDFSRASNGTYVDRDGLLKTAELYNLLSYSEDFSGYTNTNSTDEANATISPSGVKNATSFLEAATTGQHKLTTSISFDGSSTYTFSIYAKTNGRDLYIDTQNSNEWGGRAWFDLTEGTANSVLGSASIQDVGNGWYRCIVTGASILSGGNLIELLTSNGLSNSTTGDITKGVYIYGAQLVLGTEPLAYQYTNGLQGLPRISFEDGVGHLLLEPQRSNLITYSDSFNNWSKSSTNIITSDVISPSGQSNAKKIITNNATNQAYANTTATVTQSETYTFSCFAKKGEVRFICLVGLNPITFSYFDLELGVKGTSTVTSKMEDYGNGWYRCSATFTADTTSKFCGIYLTPADNSLLTSSIPNGDGNYIFGAQLEQGSYPTSYIKTEETAVTRLADVCNNSGSAQDFNSEEGVLYAEIAALANDGTFRIMSISDGTLNNRIGLFYYIDNTIWCIGVSGGVNEFQGNYLVSSTLDFHKIAIKYKVNDFSLWIDGVQVLTDTSGNAPIGLNELAFDRCDGLAPFYGKVRNLQVFTEALSDEELESLTQG